MCLPYLKFSYLLPETNFFFGLSINNFPISTHRVFYGLFGLYYKLLISSQSNGAISLYSKTCVKRPLKNRQNNDLNDNWYRNEGLKSGGGGSTLIFFFKRRLGPSIYCSTQKNIRNFKQPPKILEILATQKISLILYLDLKKSPKMHTNDP